MKTVPLIVFIIVAVVVIIFSIHIKSSSPVGIINCHRQWQWFAMNWQKGDLLWYSAATLPIRPSGNFSRPLPPNYFILSSINSLKLGNKRYFRIRQQFTTDTEWFKHCKSAWYSVAGQWSGWSLVRAPLQLFGYYSRAAGSSNAASGCQTDFWGCWTQTWCWWSKSSHSPAVFGPTGVQRYFGKGAQKIVKKYVGLPTGRENEKQSNNNQ